MKATPSTTLAARQLYLRCHLFGYGGQMREGLDENGYLPPDGWESIRLPHDAFFAQIRLKGANHRARLIWQRSVDRGIMDTIDLADPAAYANFMSLVDSSIIFANSGVSFAILHLADAALVSSDSSVQSLIASLCQPPEQLVKQAPSSLRTPAVERLLEVSLASGDEEVRSLARKLAIAFEGEAEPATTNSRMDIYWHLQVDRWIRADTSHEPWEIKVHEGFVWQDLITEPAIIAAYRSLGQYAPEIPRKLKLNRSYAEDGTHPHQGADLFALYFPEFDHRYYALTNGEETIMLAVRDRKGAVTFEKASDAVMRNAGFDKATVKNAQDILLKVVSDLLKEPEA